MKLELGHATGGSNWTASGQLSLNGRRSWQ